MQQADLRTLRRQLINPYAQMLPLRSDQESVYRFAEPNPPGLEGYFPRWEVVSMVLGAQQSLQVRVDLMSDFHLLALLGSATVNTGLGGFRAALYDVLKKRRIGSDRGIQFPNIGGAAGSAFYMREPYQFDLPRSQVIVLLQNMEVAQNTVQLVLYGVAAPFTGRLSNELPSYGPTQPGLQDDCTFGG